MAGVQGQQAMSGSQANVSDSPNASNQHGQTTDLSGIGMWAENRGESLYSP